MSTEANIETVRRLYALFAARDIRTILDVLSPDVVWGEPANPYNPCGGEYRGHEGFLKWAATGRQVEDILALEPSKMLANEDSVAVVGYTKIRVIPTGKVYETDFVHLVTLVDGKVTRFQEFFDTYAAGEAFR
jgi:uncharacterized protein